MCVLVCLALFVFSLLCHAIAKNIYVLVMSLVVLLHDSVCLQRSMCIEAHHAPQEPEAEDSAGQCIMHIWGTHLLFDGVPEIR